MQFLSDQSRSFEADYTSAARSLKYLPCFPQALQELADRIIGDREAFGSAEESARTLTLASLFLPTRWMSGGERGLHRAPDFNALSPSFERTLQDPDSLISAFAVIAIGRYGPDAAALFECIQGFSPKADDDRGHRARRWAAFQIAGIGNPRSIAPAEGPGIDFDLLVSSRGQFQFRAMGQEVEQVVSVLTDAAKGRPEELQLFLLRSLCSDYWRSSSLETLERISIETPSLTDAKLLACTLRPPWMFGGSADLTTAPTLRGGTMAKLQAIALEGAGDGAGIASAMLGRYGPAAAAVVDELIDVLRNRRHDCGVAACLPWTIFQIDGMSPRVEEILVIVAEDRGACPHAQKIAREILEMYGRRYGAD